MDADKKLFINRISSLEIKDCSITSSPVVEKLVCYKPTVLPDPPLPDAAWRYKVLIQAFLLLTNKT